MKKLITNIFNFVSDEKDKFNYKGWLVSESLGKRSLAVLGHYFVGYFLIFLSSLFFVFFLYLIVSFFEAFWS